MKRFVRGLTSFILLASLLAGPVSSAADDIDPAIASTLSYIEASQGYSDDRAFLDGYCAQWAGRVSDWYVLSLRQYGPAYDFTAYHNALSDYVKKEPQTGTSAMRCALLLMATGDDGGYAGSVLGSETDTDSITTLIFGLHLINNGAVSSKYTADSLISAILDKKLSDGGWALFGSTSDIDITAMVLQALAPHRNRADVSGAADGALSLLSARQNADGDYNSFGTDNPESTAQVLTALSALGIDCRKDSRFIKNGRTVIDGIMKYSLGDGSFSHTVGTGANPTATVQALYSLISYKMLRENRGSLYVFGKTPSVPKTTVAPTVPKTTAAPTAPPAATVPPTAAPTAPPAAASTAPTTAYAPPVPGTAAPTVPAASSPASPAATAAAPAATTAGQAATTSPAAVQGQTALPSGAASDNYTTAAAAASSDGSVSASRETVMSMEPAKKDGSLSIKLIIMIGECAAAAVAVVWLIVTGRRKPVNFVVTGVVLALALTATALTDVKTKSQFESDTTVPSGETVTVTVSIDCLTVEENGCILPPTQFEISAGATAFDAVDYACRVKGIQLDSKATANGAYIAGINYLYEKQHGDLSGWMYLVNGVFPSVGCGLYNVSDGDVIEWRYSTNIGDDLR